jgi:hypothetical protein
MFSYSNSNNYNNIPNRKKSITSNLYDIYKGNLPVYTNNSNNSNNSNNLNNYSNNSNSYNSNSYNSNSYNSHNNYNSNSYKIIMK